VTPPGPDPSVEEAGVHTLEAGIARVLRSGVAISLLLIVAGTALSFVHHPEYLRSLVALDRLTRPGIAMHSVAEVLAGLALGRGQAVVALGLLVLLATPVIRVALSLALFLRYRDRTFAALTFVVLVLLFVSLALGKVGG
jgi:uncharacterized membrane protein